ncbi:hypothetical protein C7S13_5205 [Burkholderia cepacia]|nr:hypothetical protein [Burkholderia cepacia]
MRDCSASIAASSPRTARSLRVYRCGEPACVIAPFRSPH